MKAKGFLSGLLVICVAVVAGCCAVVCEKKAPETVSAKAEERKPVKIGISVWQGYAHAFVAQEKGFFCWFNRGRLNQNNWHFSWLVRVRNLYPGSKHMVQSARLNQPPSL